MLYKTMILEVLKARPTLYEQLRQEGALTAALDRYASDLRASHLAFKEQLRERQPDSEESQVASEALELALKELEGCLPPESQDESSPLSLDEAMDFIRAHTPRG